MLPTHKGAVRKQGCIGVVNLNVIREWLGGIVLLAEHDHGAVVVQEGTEKVLKRHRFFALEQQPGRLDTGDDVSPTEPPGKFVLMEIHRCQQIKSFSRDSDDSPAAILDTHYG